MPLIHGQLASASPSFYVQLPHQLKPKNFTVAAAWLGALARAAADRRFQNAAVHMICCRGTAIWPVHCMYALPLQSTPPLHTTLVQACYCLEYSDTEDVLVLAWCRFDEECRAQVAENMRGRGVHIYSETTPIK